MYNGNKLNTIYDIDIIEKELHNILDNVEQFITTEPLDLLPIPNEYQQIRQWLQENKSGKILIYDDKDFDGTISGYIAYSVLRQMDYDVDIYVNNQHGVPAQLIQEKLDQSNYDLVIILDSSTLLVEEYSSLASKIIVIDHHVPNSSLITPPNVLLCNSKNTKGLECISAGMLTYLIFLRFYSQCTDELASTLDTSTLSMLFDDEDIQQLQVENNQRITDTSSMFELACCSLYADIVPLDNTVMKALMLYMLKYMNTTDFMSTYMDKGINKTNLTYSVIPLINYTRRLEDNELIKKIYQDDSTNNFSLLQANHKLGRQVVQTLSSLHSKVEFNNFVLLNISNCRKLLSQPIQNFKGLLCNNIHKFYNKPIITCLYIKDEDSYDISVRSEGINSLAFFKDITRYYNVVGGGHNSACGFKVKASDFKQVMAEYDIYLAGTGRVAKPIRRISIKDLHNMNWYFYSILNELCFSDQSEVIFLLDDYYEEKNIINTGSKLVIQGIHFNIITKIDTSKPILIYPMLTSATFKTYELMIENISQQSII